MRTTARFFRLFASSLLFMAALVGQIVSSLVGAGYGDEDFAALIALQAPAAGVNLQGGPGEHEGDPDGGAVRRS